MILLAKLGHNKVLSQLDQLPLGSIKINKLNLTGQTNASTTLIATLTLALSSLPDFPYP